ncbi:MAG: hypothetical protein ABI549_00495 [Flavobacterium sp.]|uniref:hypothetical protein n=1 Tax=Flavobacterium sp. TaxID=239 RepID=UPI003264607C
MNKIEFIKRTFEADKKKNIKPIFFYDVLIDGISLFDELECDENNSVCIFGYYDKKNLNIDIINQFLKTKPSELDTGRISLFICRECGDIGCGATTIDIQKNENSYIWKKFAHENNSFELTEFDYLDVQPKEFKKNEYENALNELKTKLLF